MGSDKQESSLTAILARLQQESGSTAPMAMECPPLGALHSHLVKLTQLVSDAPSLPASEPAAPNARLADTLSRLQSIIDGTKS